MLNASESPNLSLIEPPDEASYSEAAGGVLYPAYGGAVGPYGLSSPTSPDWLEASIIFPGGGDAKDRCGEVRFAVACPNKDIKPSLVHENCGRLSCPVCYESAVAQDAHAIVERMNGLKKAYEDNGGAFYRFDHVALSPPPGMFTSIELSTIEGYRRVWSWAESFIRRYVRRPAGVLVIHPWRFKHLDGTSCEDPNCPRCVRHTAVFGLHFHWAGTGWWRLSDEIYVETGGDVVGDDGATYRLLQPGERRVGPAYRLARDGWGNATFSAIEPGQFYWPVDGKKRGERVPVFIKKAPGAAKCHGAVYKKIDPGAGRDLYATVSYELSHCGLLMGPKEVLNSRGTFGDDVVPGTVEMRQLSPPYRYLGLFANCKGGFEETSKTREIQECVKCGSMLHEYAVDAASARTAGPLDRFAGLELGYDMGPHSYWVIAGRWYFIRRVRQGEVLEQEVERPKGQRKGPPKFRCVRVYEKVEEKTADELRVRSRPEAGPLTIDWRSLPVPDTIDGCRVLRDQALTWFSRDLVPWDFVQLVDRALHAATLARSDASKQLATSDSPPSPWEGRGSPASPAGGPSNAY